MCASPDTPIDTPSGERPIADLQVGDMVYSIDDGAIVAVPIARVNQTAVLPSHAMVQVTLGNGRTLEMSGGHPLASGVRFEELAPGALLDGTEVVRVETVAYDLGFTYDILPASSTGTYFAAGVQLGSTLSAR
jgi:hypothetical protein